MVKERVILAHDLIRAKPFAGGSVWFRGVLPGAVPLAQSRLITERGYGWAGGVQLPLQKGPSIPPASSARRTYQ